MLALLLPLPGAIVVPACLLLVAALLLLDLPGKYPALALTLFLWFALLATLLEPLMRLVPLWLALLLCGSAMVGCVLWAGRIGLDWGLERAKRHAMEGRALRDWQWIYTGPHFAKVHPLHQGRGGVWVVIVWVGLYGAATLAAFARVPFHWSLILGVVVIALLCIFTLRALWRRHPAAYPLTWIVLGLTFPISAPLMVYWADGVRPNLVYRWRFERLYPGPTGEEEGGLRWNSR